MAIRLRLTIWYTLVLAVLLLVFSGSLYAAMHITLTSEVDRGITDRAREVSGLIRVFERPWLETQLIRLPNVNVFSAPDTFIQVTGPEGRVIARSSNLSDAVLPHAAEELAGLGPATYVVGGSRVRLYNYPLLVDGKQVGTIQTARSLYEVDFALLRLRLILIGGSLIMLAVTALVTALVARSVTRPLDAITVAAARIGATQNLTERVQHRGPRDEIGRFADAFNSMLERLQGAYAQLSEAFESQRRFLADISHQLRTPLTVIRGNADLLRRARENDDVVIAEAAITDIEAEASRMSHLVDDLLTLARVESGQSAEKRPVLIGEVLIDAVRQVRAVAGDHRLTTQISGEVHDSAVLGHETYLQQLFSILLDNAVKFSAPDGRIVLTADVRGHAVVVAVADNGIGIPEPEQQRVFERFYRGANARSHSGSGLGLAIAHWVASDHQGSITLSSQQGAGSRFTVTLPLFTGDPSFL